LSKVIAFKNFFVVKVDQFFLVEEEEGLKIKTNELVLCHKLEFYKFYNFYIFAT